MTLTTRPPCRIRRTGHVALTVPDVPRSLDFYTRILRLTRVEESDGVTYLRSQYEHHCLELHAGEVAGVLHTGWETDSDEETEALQAHMTRLGVPLREAPPEPGRRGEAFQFQDSNGLWHEVYRAMDRVAALVADGPFPVLRQAHFAFNTPDVDRELTFFKSVGFRVSDWLPGLQGSLRCNADHHGISLFKFERGRLHHHGYDIGTWEHLKIMLDWMASQGWPVEVGPVRHATGNNISIYFPDPDRIRVEIYCEMEQIWDDEDHEARRQPHVFDLWQQKPPPPGFRE
jgi:catechol 2,3-dioxygenase-like lactoylglutathione lyase family enzyme